MDRLEIANPDLAIALFGKVCIQLFMNIYEYIGVISSNQG